MIFSEEMGVGGVERGLQILQGSGGKEKENTCTSNISKI